MLLSTIEEGDVRSIMASSKSSAGLFGSENDLCSEVRRRGSKRPREAADM